MEDKPLSYRIRYKIFKLFNSATLRLALGFIVLLSIIAFLFSRIEGLSFYDSVYWAITTTATVGYGDISPKTIPGKFEAMLVMIGGVAILGYLLSNLSNSLASMNLGRLMGLSKTKKQGHTIILGWNPLAKHALEELVEKNQDIVVVDTQSRLELNAYPKTQFVLGDLNDKSTLVKAGVINAKNIILTMYEDSEVILALNTIRKLNSRIKIVSRVDDVDLGEVANTAGSDECVSPSLIGGKLIRAALEEPAVVKFVDEISTASHGGDLVELFIKNHPEWKGKRIEEIKLPSAFIVIAFCNGSTRKITSIPDKKTILDIEDSLIIIDYTKKKRLDTKKHLVDRKTNGSVLMLGWNRTLKSAIEELHSRKKITVLTNDIEESEEAHYRKMGIKIIKGRIEKYNLINKVNVANSDNIIVGMRNDSDVILTTYIIRTLNKKANIVARVDDSVNNETAYAAGANHIVSPSEIGGRMLSKSIFYPNAIRWLVEATTMNKGVDLKALPLTKFPQYQNKKIKELKLPKNMMLVSLDKNSDSILADLDKDYVLKKEDTILVIKNN